MLARWNPRATYADPGSLLVGSTQLNVVGILWEQGACYYSRTTVFIPGPKDTSINGVTYFHDICDVRNVLVLSDEQKLLLLLLFSLSYVHLYVGLPWILRSFVSTQRSKTNKRRTKNSVILLHGRDGFGTRASHEFACNLLWVGGLTLSLVLVQCNPYRYGNVM